MKKLLSFILLATLCFSFASCTLFSDITTENGANNDSLANDANGSNTATGGAAGGGASSSRFITRGEWIHSIVEAYGYDDITGDELFFTDIEQSRYKKSIQMAVLLGIVPIDSSTFRPEDPATREFAALTAIRSLGYVTDEDITCDDASEIAYPKEAKLAVELGLITLQKGKFLPSKNLQSAEKKRILNEINDTLSSLEISDSESDIVDYKDNVTVLNSATNNGSADPADSLQYLPDGRLILDANSVSNSFGYGDIFVIGSEAFRVEYTEKVDDSVYVEFTKPAPEEVLDELCISGSSTLDFENFVPADGVTVEEYSTYSEARPRQAARGLEILNPDFVLSGKIDLDNGHQIEYKIKAKRPKVDYKCNINFWTMNVKNAFIKIEAFEADVSVDYMVDFDNFPEHEAKKVHLGNVPIVGSKYIAGVSIDLYIVFDAKGGVTLEFGGKGVFGVQVLNNRPRNISAFNTYSSIGVSAEIKAGLKVSFGFQTFGADIINANFEFGPCVSGYTKFRGNGVCCMDAAAYLYAEINAFDEDLIDKWLHFSITWEIFNEENSPLKVRGHWENLQRVSECTYSEVGTIIGSVANADNHNTPIENANVVISSSLDNNPEEIKVLSDERGQYTVTVKDGTYLIRISKEGYIPFDSVQTVLEGQIVYVQTFLMVEGEEGTDEEGIIGGNVINALTGGTVGSVSISVRKGWNMTSGDKVTEFVSNEDGSYQVSLPLGNYTLLIEKDGFVTNHINVAVTRNGNMQLHATITPNESSELPVGDLRVVLTWGATPSDLDSHLIGPSSNGSGKFHVYFGSMEYSFDGTRMAFLDVDDITSYGPETTTVYNMAQSGTYSFYVHDFSNGHSSSSTQMSESQACVKVYVGDVLAATYYVPTATAGTLWHVFDFDAATRTIYSVNTFTFESDSSNVGK